MKKGIVALKGKHFIKKKKNNKNITTASNHLFVITKIKKETIRKLFEVKHEA